MGLIVSMLLIVYIFIVLVIVYIFFGLKQIPSFDIIMISFSLVIIIGTILQGIMYNKKTSSISEHFTTTDITLADIQNYEPIVLEENIKPISSRLVNYITAFNKNSFNEKGNLWLNLAVTKTDGTCNTDASNSVFTFELPPVYSRKSGFYLGNNRLVGPLCSALNIQYHNTFTQVFVCKHGNLLVDKTNNEIELIKLYANSPNNNGLSLYIQNGSLQNINNVQMGTLMFQYADKNPLQCKLKAEHDLIPFEKDILTFYFIIKETDHIRICMMTETNNNVNEILLFNVENTDITFSNKELVINRMKNWNGNIFAYGIYNVPLADDDITKFYAHLLSEYMKYINQNYIDMINQYNDTIAMLGKFLGCPYNKTVCDQCSTVKLWNDPTQVLTSSTQCRKAINDFCIANVNHPLCSCWNTQNPTYKNNSCKLFRSIFINNQSYLDGLSQADIDYIMSKYGLITPENCPKPITQTTFLKNKYPDYDFEKMKVYVDGTSSSDKNKVLKVYPEPEQDDKDKIHIGHKHKDGDLIVDNFHKEDPVTNFKLIKGELIPKTTNGETIKVPTLSAPPVSTESTQQDNFFNRFMKIALPN